MQIQLVRDFCLVLFMLYLPTALLFLRCAIFLSTFSAYLTYLNPPPPSLFDLLLLPQNWMATDAKGNTKLAPILQLTYRAGLGLCVPPPPDSFYVLSSEYPVSWLKCVWGIYISACNGRRSVTETVAAINRECEWAQAGNKTKCV